MCTHLHKFIFVFVNTGWTNLEVSCVETSWVVPLITSHGHQLGYGDGFQDQVGWLGGGALPKDQLNPQWVARLASPASMALRSSGNGFAAAAEPVTTSGGLTPQGGTG